MLVLQRGGQVRDELRGRRGLTGLQCALAHQAEVRRQPGDWHLRPQRHLGRPVPAWAAWAGGSGSPTASLQSHTIPLGCQDKRSLGPLLPPPPALLLIHLASHFARPQMPLFLLKLPRFAAPQHRAWM